jgi:hypothetical protein
VTRRAARKHLKGKRILLLFAGDDCVKIVLESLRYGARHEGHSWLSQTDEKKTSCWLLASSR